MSPAGQPSLSASCPAGVRAPHAGAFGPDPNHNQLTAPSLPTLGVDGDGGRDQIEILVGRGVNPAKAQQLADQHTPERIRAAVAYFDEQQAGSVGAGVLVRAVEEGRRPTRRPTVDAGVGQVAAWRRLWDWSAAHFPDLCDDGEPHPAVIGAVWLLGGPDKVRLPEQDAWIRGRIAVWDSRWQDRVVEEPAAW